MLVTTLSEDPITLKNPMKTTTQVYRVLKFASHFRIQSHEVRDIFL